MIGTEHKREITGFNGDVEEYKRFLTFVSTFRRAVRTLSSALSMLMNLKMSKISPDGKLGGQPYAMYIPDILEKATSSTRILAEILTTLEDENRNPVWKEIMGITEEAVGQLESAAQALESIDLEEPGVVDTLVEDQVAQLE